MSEPAATVRCPLCNGYPHPDGKCDRALRESSNGNSPATAAPGATADQQSPQGPACVTGPAPVYPAGLELIQAGKCPVGGRNPMACMFCTFGHMTECHYPKNCADAECSHYQREVAAEGLRRMSASNPICAVCHIGHAPTKPHRCPAHNKPLTLSSSENYTFWKCPDGCCELASRGDFEFAPYFAETGPTTND